MANRPLTVSPTGDISVHIDEDIDILFVPGTSMASFSGRDIVFEIQDTDVVVPVSEHPSNSDGVRILVPNSDFSTLDINFARFAVVDRTGGENKTLWFGRLEIYK